MKIDNKPDPHDAFKRGFVQVVNEYSKDPTDQKQNKLQKIVKDAIQKDGNLLYWFNTMFKWENTPFGLHVQFKHNPKIPS
mgnify:CR=1 FL=1|tara:strand:+ start:321 stop:560 length:240 start_codon:yes stop_codon:yes gene_type:complete